MINSIHKRLQKIFTIILFCIIPIFGYTNSLKDFTITDTSGNIHDYDSLQGKYVILNFWATWCPPCVEEIPELAKLYDQFHDNVAILGMNYQVDITNEKVNAFSNRLGANYPNVLYLRNKQAFDDKNIRVLPTTIIYDTAGEEIFFHEGIVTQDMLLELLSLSN